MAITHFSQGFDGPVNWVADDGSAGSYRYGERLPKACVHPLVTPRGHCLSAFEPSDHVWHRGLWFTIKYINGTNFWEETEEGYGAQTVRRPLACTYADANTVRIKHDLAWSSAATGRVFDEQRILTCRTLADGVRGIDWHSVLTPTDDLTLDRTPFTTWGGYGGLSFRAARELHQASFMLPGGETAEAIAGQTHPWVVLQGKMDGGRDQRVSIGLIDHPANPRSPVSWYGKVGAMNFINAAFLFHEKMQVPRGQALSFRYRVLYRDGQWTSAQFAALAEAFARETI